MMQGALDAATLPAHATTVALGEWPQREALYFAPHLPPTALVIELHGSGLDPLRQYRMSRLADRLIPKGVAVLLPQAGAPFQLMPELPSGFAWNIPGVPLPGSRSPDGATADDASYIAALVRAFQLEPHLRDAPLFLAGYSGGARLASQLLTSGGLAWSGVGLVGGLRPPERGTRPPPPTVSLHGRADRINPYGGGDGPRWDIGVEEAGDRYAAAQGCAPQPLESQVGGAWRRIYRSPEGDEALVTYAVDGAAHAWPGTQDADHLAAFGPAGDGMDASRLIAEFFLSQVDAWSAAQRIQQ